jgi:hypothetical protein
LGRTRGVSVMGRQGIHLLSLGFYNIRKDKRIRLYGCLKRPESRLFRACIAAPSA